MVNPFDKLLAEVATLREAVARQRTTLTLGTYQSDGTVLLTDGAEVVPAAVLAVASAGDKVLLGQHGRRAYVLGQASPAAAGPSWASGASTVTVDTAGQATIAHGMSTTPTTVLLQVMRPGSSSDTIATNAEPIVWSVNATHITVRVINRDTLADYVYATVTLAWWAA